MGSCILGRALLFAPPVWKHRLNSNLFVSARNEIEAKKKHNNNKKTVFSYVVGLNRPRRV